MHLLNVNYRIMKKSIFPVIALAMCLFSCKDKSQIDDTLSLTESQIEADIKGGEYSLSVICKGPWSATVESGNDWLSLSPTEGEGTTVVTVTTQPGSDYAIAYITFTYKDQNSYLTVVRRANSSAGNDAVQLDKNAIDSPAEGGDFEINVTSNVKWMVDKTASWITVSPGIGSKNGKISVKIDPTDTYSKTQGSITVFEVGNSKETGVVIPVVREGIRVAEYAVSDTKKVIFAPGNLQYSRSQNIFRFAEHQYDYIGKDNEHIAESFYPGWIDLFGWGTSGYNEIYPYTCSKEYVDYYYTSDIAGTDYDWGQYNPISNDFYNSYADKGYWRTPTQAEIEYLLKYKYEKGEAGIVKVVELNLDYYIIILPDGLVLPEEYDLKIKDSDYAVYTMEQLLYVQAQGAVILPAMSGLRSGSEFDNTDRGGYWTSTLQYEYSQTAYVYYPAYGILGVAVYLGNSVRLVHDVK